MPTWESTGDWYRDYLWESVVETFLREEEQDITVTVASLDANPDDFEEHDLSLHLMCLDDHRVAYLTPYSLVVPPEANIYIIGIWDLLTATWRDEEHYEYPLALTDDGSSVFLEGRAQVRQLVELIKKAAEYQNPDYIFTAGIADSTGETETQLWSGFDLTGFEDAFEYLGCF